MNKDSVTLKWEKPNDDGGTPVTGYIIKTSEVLGDVKEPLQSATIAAHQMCYTVRDLKPANTYMFEVAAINQNGEGDCVTCKFQYTSINIHV